MSHDDAVRIRRVDTVGEQVLHGLCDVLIDCVEGGASVSFMAPMTRAKAAAFWRRVADGVARGERRLFVAEDARDTVLGTVQVVVDQPENQPHRADVSKMLVRRSARGRGIGQALLATAEADALACSKTLLVLDTASDAALRLYERASWQRCGVIPDYALLPDGRPCATIVMWKRLVQ